MATTQRQAASQGAGAIRSLIPARIDRLPFIGGIVAALLGVNAERKALEDVAKPLGVIGKAAEAIFRSGSSPRPAS